ncbi:MAG: chemotaxis protein CheX [Spirochaetes bacterium]|nr:chemotaxis protein CheX [Spirochaetota bacterium]
MKNQDANVPDLITDAELDQFVDRLLQRAKQFLETEGRVAVKVAKPLQGQLDRMELKDLTSILTVEDRLKLIVAFSFERSLMEAVFQGYTEGVSIEPGEEQLLMEETAGDCINIVVGNALQDFQLPGYAFTLSTPIIINEGKSIQRYKQSKLTSGEILTEKGTMLVLCITPGIYYKKTLEIEASE